MKQRRVYSPTFIARSPFSQMERLLGPLLNSNSLSTCSCETVLRSPIMHHRTGSPHGCAFQERQAQTRRARRCNQGRNPEQQGRQRTQGTLHRDHSEPDSTRKGAATIPVTVLGHTQRKGLNMPKPGSGNSKRSWNDGAVVDQATGRVWNERNRYRADRQIWADTESACVATHGSSLLNFNYTLCSAASNGFYNSIRVGGAARGANALTDFERDSVEDPTHHAYDRGMKVMDEPLGCLYGTNERNRCLPIHYIQRNGNPFIPQNHDIIPTGTVMKLEVVWANLQSVEGPPSPFRPPAALPAIFDDARYRNTIHLELEAASPFVVGDSPDLTCSDPTSKRHLFTESGNYLRSENARDSELKVAPFYMMACGHSTTTTTGENSMALVLREARFPRTGDDYLVRTGAEVHGYPNMNAYRPGAILTPDPSQTVFAEDGTWYRYRLITYNPLTRARVVLNPNDDTPVAEITISATRDYCLNGADTDDGAVIFNQGFVKLSMCEPGEATVELRDSVTHQVVNSYLLRRAGSVAPDPCDSSPIPLSLPQARTYSWETSDCAEGYLLNRYVDFYTLQVPTTRVVQVDLASTSVDPYLMVYRGTGTSGTPYLQDNDGGTGNNSKLRFNAIGGVTYTIGASTNRANAVGSYTITTSAPTPTVPPPPPTGVAGTPCGTDCIEISWDENPGATWHRLQYQYGTRWITVNSYIHDEDYQIVNLDCGTTYSVRVGARGDGVRYARDWSLTDSYGTGRTSDCLPPVFGQSTYDFFASETLAVGRWVGTVAATDPDGNDALVRYSIVAGNGLGHFAMNSVSGFITVASTLDYDTRRYYYLTVEATDDDDLTGRAYVRVEVQR